MNYQKYLTALLYSIEMPLGVWAGFEFGVLHYFFGVVIVIIMMVVKVAAVVTWMNAQAIEIETHGARSRKIRRKR